MGRLDLAGVNTLRVALLYSPDFNRPTMVFGALPLFNACLKRAGHETLVIDVNAEAFTYFLSPGRLEQYFAILDAAIAELGRRAHDDEASRRQLAELRQLLVFPRDLILQARDAADGLRDPTRFYEPRLYRRFDRVIRSTHKFLNSFTPQLDPRNSSYVADLHAFLSAERRDPYIEYYNDELFPRLEAFAPDLVAFSAPFSPQVATGLDLARRARSRLPKARFVMGGTGVSDTPDLILADVRFYDHIDYGIVGDGEDALPLLAAAIAGEAPFDDVPGLWRRDGDTIVRPSRHDMVDLDTTPTPDYTDVDFSHYMLPEKAGIYTTSRGCYYGKCTFCPESFRVGFRKRAPERVYDDVKDMVERQGVRFLHFFDPLTPPVTLEHVAKRVARAGLDVHWYAEVKFEKIYTNRDYVRKLAAGGCRQLQFGFESGVQRVLDRMKKGNNLGHIEIILGHLREYGISMVGTWFIGFPTETEDEALETWRYWRRHPEEMQLSLYTGTFSLGPEVPVFHSPEEYGVRVVYQDDGYARCLPIDGDYWDRDPLHTAFHVRSDIEVTICGAGLLYAAHCPERLYELRGVNAVGPTSHDDPPLAERVARVSEEVHIIALDPGLDGRSGHRGFVAESLRTFDLDSEDVALLQALGRDGRALGDLIAASPDAAAATRRLALLVDRGFIESPDPASVGIGWDLAPRR